MTSQIQEGILKSLYLILKPLARMLLRSGIGFKEFGEVAKAAFVHEASAGYGIRGRDTNMSRVAIMTGLSRREVKKIKQQNYKGSLVSMMAHPGAEVISQWRNDSRFSDSHSGPKVLHLEQGDNSFADLVRLYAGDIPVGAMKTELLRIGAVEQLEGQRLRLLKEDYTPSGIDEKLELGLREIIRPALETLEHNCDANRSGALFFQRVVGAIGIGEEDVPELRTRLTKGLTGICESMDSIASEYVPEFTDARSDTEVGIGLYYYEITRDGL